VVFLVMGLLGLWLVSSSKLADRWLSTIVERLLNRYTSLNVKDYASLLHLTGEYRLVELNIRRNDWVDGKKMSDIRLRDEGINVLGIRKADGNYVGNPIGDTRIEQKDTLVVYGHIEAIKKIDLRKKGVRGDIDHVKAVKKQKQEVSKEKKKE
jgi:NhaP-type Na+/H+ and K+/H+ antiporter